jgi:hypothetical protein
MNLLSTLLALAVTLASTITLSAVAVQLLVGVLLPVFIGAVTKSNASAGLKQALTVILVGLSALLIISTLSDGTAVISLETLLLTAGGWVVTIAAYHGLYKPHDLNGHLAPDSGLGGAIEATGYERRA